MGPHRLVEGLPLEVQGDLGIRYLEVESNALGAKAWWSYLRDHKYALDIRNQDLIRMQSLSQGSLI